MSDFVSLNYIEEYDVNSIADAVKEAFFALNLDKLLKPKMKVLIKVNVPNPVAKDFALTTNPAVVAGVVNLLSSFGVQCIVADSPYKIFTTDYLDRVYIETGMLEMANTTKCELNHNLKVYEQSMPNGKKSKSLYLLDVINDVDAIVNIGKVKIDERFGYLGACSNMFGLLPGEYKTLVLNRLKNLKDFNNLTIDLIEQLQDKIYFNVLDGIVAQEAGNSQRVLSCLAISDNVFKLDAALLKILNINLDNTILKQAEERKLINLKNPFKTINEEVEKFKVEDFALFDFNNEKELHNSNQQKTYFKLHQKRVHIKPKKCKGCGVCSKICPTDAIMMKYDKNGELYAEIDYNKCIFCFRCREMCPYKVVDLKTPFAYKTLINKIEKYNKNTKEE